MVQAVAAVGCTVGGPDFGPHPAEYPHLKQGDDTVARAISGQLGEQSHTLTFLSCLFVAVCGV